MWQEAVVKISLLEREKHVGKNLQDSQKRGDKNEKTYLRPLSIQITKEKNKGSRIRIFACFTQSFCHSKMFHREIARAYAFLVWNE